MAATSKLGLFRRHPWVKRALLLGFTFCLFAGLGLAFASWSLVCRGGACPSVEVLEDYRPRQTSKLYAADGRFIAELGLERRTLIALDDIPKQVQAAFVITEDKRFYRHSGIDWIRVPGAVVRNIQARAWAQGFSTITMQLARNIFPEAISREKSLVRKLKEAKVAREIEAHYSKEKILELYLNQIYLGSGAYGVETAAQRYFGKSARDLNLAEAATLAALPKAPERYNPRRFAENAIRRRNTIVELMRREGAITDAEASLAKAYPLQLATRSASGEVAPYFVEWVRKALDDRFGRQLYEQGLKVYTTLDLDQQLAAERALERQLRAVESGQYGKFNHLSYESYVARAATGGNADTPNSPYLQGAFVALDPRSGAVRALVGGRDFDDSKFNRATQALRQPGSTFKPFVYAAAVERGYSPAYLTADSPISIPQAGGTDWTPQNYDRQFLGPVPLRRALYMSRNLSAINVGREVGEQNVIDMAHRFGISTPIPAYPSIHIGSADVIPLEMIASYGVFATLGARATPYAITRVENAQGQVLWQPSREREQVLPPAEAWLMVDMMKDVIRRGTAYQATWGAGLRVPAGGKTGTTNDGTDVWFIGYTADLVAGVWMGFDRPQKIKANAQGGQLAAPAWTAFMTEVYSRKPAPPDWPRPESIVVREVDPASGELYGLSCATETPVTEYFIAGTEPTEPCGSYPSPFRITDSTATSPTVPQPPRETFNPFRIPPR